MCRKSSLVLLAVLLISSTFYGQTNLKKSIHISYEKSSANDTIWLTIHKDVKQKPGTLLLIASEKANGVNDTSYFPIVDTSNQFALTIPQQYRTGTLQLKALFYPEIMHLNGVVIYKDKDETIKALVFHKDEILYTGNVTLNSDNQFALPGMVFDNTASFLFTYSSKSKAHPNVSIEMSPAQTDFRDSVFSENIVLTKEDTIPETVTTVVTKKDIQPVKKNLVDLNTKNKVKDLQGVTVTATRKSAGQKYNEQYSTGMFKSTDEKVIDCLSNDFILSFPDCLSFLRSQVAGITVDVDRLGESVMHWRGHQTKAFFIDEISVDIDDLLNVSVSDIAIVKAYPPPFTGGVGAGGKGDGGAIAIYTRQGEYQKMPSDGNKWIFSIKGYSPVNYSLFSEK